MSKVAERQLGRRNEIIQSARRLIRKHGIADVTLSMVVKDVGFARPNFYRVFGDKGELISAVINFETAEINARRQKEIMRLKSFERQIVRSLELAVEIVDSEELWSLLVEPGNIPYTAYVASHDPEMLAANKLYWTPILDKAASKGELREGLDLQQVMTWLLGVQFMFMERREIFPTIKAVGEYARIFVVPALVATAKSARR